MEVKFWRNHVVYQIYCRSFCDSNGDGIGDIPGIISKLDYLASLRVGILWLNPIYPSPQFDMGYDVSDYYSINPEYGSMEDFDTLLKEAKKRGMRIVMDLVVNHTSSEHPWFQASRDPSSPYHDFYIWRDGKKKDCKTPPNNWTSQFSGPAWTYDEQAKQWYLHLFAKEQPDLNWHNPQVLIEVEKILRFWLDKGVYGFRCDVINQIWKDSLKDGKGFAFNGRGQEHYLMKEGNHKILRSLYADVFSHYDSVVIGETYNVDKANGVKFLTNHELDMFFEFDRTGVDRRSVPIFKKKFKAKNLRKILYSWQEAIEWNANYFENHDQLRSLPRFGDPKRYFYESGSALACLNFCLRGTPFIYQGEEIGMLNLPMSDPSLSQDVTARTVDSVMAKMLFPKWLRKRLIYQVNRDNCRSPMQWDCSLSSGFSSSASTWIKVNDNYKTINVEKQSKDKNSLLFYYKKLIALHNRSDILCLGTFHAYQTRGDLFAFSRCLRGKSMLILINLGHKKASLPEPLRRVAGSVVLSNYLDAKASNTFLRPYEALIIELD
jgi:oligo-1,6-glucosidase